MPRLPRVLGVWAFSILSLALTAYTAPNGFPTSGNGLWYKTQGSSWSKEWLPIGNGYLAAMTSGGTNEETTQLNIESLWSGGPFQDPSYNGGNKQPSERAAMASDMQTIRESIFQSPSGTIDNVEELATDAGAYGAYAGAGYLITTMDVDASVAVSDYARWLDMDQAIARTTWSQSGSTFDRVSFCSNPSQACFQHVNTSASILPNLIYTFDTAIESGLPQPVVSCLDNSTLVLRGNVSNPGMAYELLGRVTALGPSSQVACSSQGAGNATISVTGAKEAWIAWVGGTNYDMNAGDAAHGFSFKGEDPHNGLVALLNSASPKILSNPNQFASILAAHVSSYESLIGSFALSLGQTPDFSKPTDELVAAYMTDTGNPYVEWLMFNLGRYLLASSAPGTLPANLQGKWARDIQGAWSADYHANINLQMNYWFAEMTGMDVVTPLFDYMEKTWVPRGSDTAKVLYNIERGWVTHNEMNIFGHTGMKLSGNSASWADYPESAVWMMTHVWDHFDYTNDVAWWKSQGWPLLKGVASFHLDKLIPDLHFNDSSLVVNPCNSPEQTPITLGCAHAQQLIWQLFNAVEKGFEASGDSDTSFLQEIRQKKATMDKGIHVGSWGQLQEWKVDMDSPTDTHRHLSHLVGLYPGYALSSYDSSIQAPPSKNSPTYTKTQVLSAAQISLTHRGNGTGPDADAGWEKVWRAAAWAQLGDSEQFYHELTYSIFENFGANLFSLYGGGDDPIFQIDANFGYTAALLNALVQAPDVPSLATPLIITILPALPNSWPTGSVVGVKIRGGLTLDLHWANSKPSSATIKASGDLRVRPVQVVYAGKVVSAFTTAPGDTNVVHF